ncbi:hypothetical protein [Mesorhizobium sp. M0029]|uniref:hypothetical protein n=1 Tax=Mesorhizobium sp. M0029 TaxID=2956850 RepID=UPI00333CE6FD
MWGSLIVKNLGSKTWAKTWDQKPDAAGTAPLCIGGDLAANPEPSLYAQLIDTAGIFPVAAQGFLGYCRATVFPPAISSSCQVCSPIRGFMPPPFRR